MDSLSEVGLRLPSVRSRAPQSRGVKQTIAKFPLIGKVAVVTGGSRGIGRAVAIRLAAEGADVAISYLRNDRAAALTARRIRQLGRNAYAERIDLRDYTSISPMFERIRDRYGKVDIMVHCAALTLFRPLVALSPVQFDRIMAINVRAFLVCVQEACKFMKRGGTIIVLSSLGSQRYVTGYGALGLAKACLEAAVRYLAVELAPKGIRVNAVCGGPVDTDGARAFPYYRAGLRESIRLTPAGRIATPDDVAQVVLFLCRRESEWIRGQTLVADGGLSLRLLSL